MELEFPLDLVERRLRSIEVQMNSLNSKLEDSLKWQQILEPWLLRTFNMNMTSLMNLAKLEAARSRISSESHRIKPSQPQRTNSSQYSSRIPSGENLLKRKRSDLEEEFQNSSPPPENRSEVMTVVVVDPLSMRTSRNNGTSISLPPPTGLNLSEVHEILEDVTPVITIESLSDFPSSSRGIPSRLSPTELQSQDQNTYPLERCDSDEIVNEELESVLCSDIKIEVEEAKAGEEIDVPTSVLTGSTGIHLSIEEVNTISQRIDPPDGSLDFEEFSIDVERNVYFPSPSASGKLDSLPVSSTMSPGKEKSLVWQYFEKISDITARCLLCKGGLSRRGGTTTTLRNHLKLKHKELFQEMLQREADENLHKVLRKTAVSQDIKMHSQ